MISAGRPLLRVSSGLSVQVVRENNCRLQRALQDVLVKTLRDVLDVAKRCKTLRDVAKRRNKMQEDAGNCGTLRDSRALLQHGLRPADLKAVLPFSPRRYTWINIKLMSPL